MSSQISLYSGPGTSSICSQAMENRLNELIDDRKHRVSRINSLSNLLLHPQSTRAIFVPGGNAVSIWYKNDLQPVSSSIVETLDKYSISYFGACAGGIIASSSVHGRLFSEIEPNVFSARDYKFLSLIPGKVIAPLFPDPISQGKEFSLNDFLIRSISLTHSIADQHLYCGHILSPGYIDCSEIDGVEILSMYTDLPSFNISSCRKEGWSRERVIDSHEIAESIFYQRPEGAPILVTGSHPEISSLDIATEDFKEAFNISNEQQSQLEASMRPGDEARKALLKSYLEKIGVACKP